MCCLKNYVKPITTKNIENAPEGRANLCHICTLEKIQGRLTKRNLFGGGKRFDRDDTLENSSQIQMMIF